MAKRSKTIDAPIVIPAGQEKLVRFGWCSDGHHQGCAVQFTGHRCNCECHGGIIESVGEVQDE